MDEKQLRHCRRFLLSLLFCIVLTLPLLQARENQQKRNTITAISTAKQLALVVMRATQDNKEHFLDLSTPEKALSRYVKDRYLFVSPQTGKPFVFDKRLSGIAVSTLARPDERIVFYESESEIAQVVAFADGRVALVSAADWAHRTDEGYCPHGIKNLRTVTPNPSPTPSPSPLRLVLDLLIRVGLVLPLAAGATVAAMFTGWKRVGVFFGYSALYVALFALLALVLAVFVPSSRGYARLI